jgi:hypothetical protein
MKVNPSNLVGNQENIEAILSLADSTKRAILNTYQLKITLSDISSQLVYTTATGKQKIALSSHKNLSLFTYLRDLNLEDKILIIPFTLVPATGVNNISITFELLDKNDINIQNCHANWSNITKQVGLSLVLPNERIIEEKAMALTTETYNQPLRSLDILLAPLNQTKVKEEEQQVISKYSFINISNSANLANVDGNAITIHQYIKDAQKGDVNAQYILGCVPKD